MIISYEHNFIFIKTHKTAGSTMQYIFGTFCGPGDVVTPVFPWETWMAESKKRFVPRNYIRDNPNKPYWQAHEKGQVIHDRIGSYQWDSMFKFCFERNPWAKVVSWWMYRRRNGKIQKDFTEWLRHTYDLGKIGPPRLPWDWGHYTINDTIAVDFIGMYENLDHDLQYVLDKLDLKYDGPWPRLKNNNWDQDYRKFYKPDTRDKVAEIFHREIERFGYEF